MTRIRLFIFITTVAVVTIFGFVASYYARGYRFDNTGQLSPSGLLVANSNPNGAQIYINGELKTASNATITLPPGTYDVSLKKESYFTWNKRIKIEKEVVTQIDAQLFPAVPSLSAITFSGAVNPIVSPDGTKIAYSVPFNTDNLDKAGLWVLETLNLPLGFNRDPHRITDGNLEGAVWEWSPDSRQILLTTKAGTFLLEAGSFTPQNQRINIATTVSKTRVEWEKAKKDKLTSQLSRLPDELIKVFQNDTKNIIFSPDENKILYTATGSGELKERLIKSLPGSSTQEQVRSIKKDQMYIFDIKEDRNFKVSDSPRTIYWLPNSINLVIPEEDKITLSDYDGTNHQTVYAGSYIAPFALPSPNLNHLFVLTNLGAKDSPTNIYSLNLR